MGSEKLDRGYLDRINWVLINKSLTTQPFHSFLKSKKKNIYDNNNDNNNNRKH